MQTKNNTIEELTELLSNEQYKYCTIIEGDSVFDLANLTERSYEKRPEGTVMRIESFTQDTRKRKYAIRVNLDTAKDIIINSRYIEFKAMPYYIGSKEFTTVKLMK